MKTNYRLTAIILLLFITFAQGGLVAQSAPTVPASTEGQRSAQLVRVSGGKKHHKQTPAPTPNPGWTDSATGLTWTPQDNPQSMNWSEANSYCTSLRLGGYATWRLPTIDELAGLCINGDENVNIPKGGIKTNSASVWASTPLPGYGYYAFTYSNCGRNAWQPSNNNDVTALCTHPAAK